MNRTYLPAAKFLTWGIIALMLLSSCNIKEDRDIKAAKTILKIGLTQLGLEQIKVKPTETMMSIVNEAGS